MNFQENCNKYRGFTLLEVAIVIAIIALIIGGIVAGRTMIRTAEIREMLGEYDSYIKSVKEFQDKYNQLPGDMVNAQTLWGADTCPTNAASSPKVVTCNGNGDGKIGDSSSAGVVAAGPASYTEEWFRAWQQLSNAGLIQGKYSGTRGSAGNANETTTGTNIPKSKLSNGGWLLMIYFNTSGSSDAWADNYGHILQFGASAGSGARNIGAVLVPYEARDIDMKLDDAAPGTGKIRAWRTNTNASCTTSDSSATAAVYSTTATSPACAPFFITGF